MVTDRGFVIGLYTHKDALSSRFGSIAECHPPARSWRATVEADVHTHSRRSLGTRSDVGACATSEHRHRAQQRQRDDRRLHAS
jgi:hypothetical protein